MGEICQPHAFYLDAGHWAYDVFLRARSVFEIVSWIISEVQAAASLVALVAAPMAR